MCPPAGPLDEAKFNVVEFINRMFPTEQVSVVYTLQSCLAVPCDGRCLCSQVHAGGYMAWDPSLTCVVCAGVTYTVLYCCDCICSLFVQSLNSIDDAVIKYRGKLA